MSLPYRTVAVCGLTAAGKTDLALDIAQALGGEIVNIDSVQVYRELNIGAAKLPPNKRRGIPHPVLDIFDATHQGHVAQFRSAALSAINDITSRGKLPLLVGGSGMYFTTLLHGLAEVPPSSSDVRAEVAALTTQEQYKELELVDPVSAQRLNPNDRQRISRAVEVYRITGKPASEFLARHEFAQVDVVSLVVVICRPRDVLYQRIDQRSQEMVDNGLVAETQALLSKYGRQPIFAALGYKQACEFIEGSLDQDALVPEIAMHTRRFAKRQMTFWRNEPKKRGWIVRPSLGDDEAKEVAGFSHAPQRAQNRMKGFRAFCWSQDELIANVQKRLDADLQQTEVWYVSL